VRQPVSLRRQDRYRPIPVLRWVRHQIVRVVHAAQRTLQSKYVLYRGSVLPIPGMRLGMCGAEFTNDEFYLESGVAEARRVVAKLGYTSDCRVVEIGSGLGRFATGLLREVGDVDYWGFDAVEWWVDWCKKYIERRHPTYRFHHINVENELYNPGGVVKGDQFRFPLPDGHADIVYMWGVVTNMRFKDARNYIAEIGRLTRPGGRVFLTAWVEEDVPEETVNPDDYVNYQLEGPLWVVRYQKAALFSLFEQHGLVVEQFGHHAGGHCNQSEIYLRKRTNGAQRSS
jgi:SAM-dependent methyltransferase